jgi:TonB family protein
LSTDTIKKVIKKHYNQYKYCYEKQLVQNPKLEGKVTLKFVIAADGKVSEASVIETTIKSKPLQACMIKAAKRMLFPKPRGGGIVVVNYPFLFKAAK